MRADRLIALLMLLQARGRLTAAQLAAELEVSERTIYRDVDALSASGVPVYGDAGREGGYRLSEGYRTSLTGLTPAETQALFMFALSIPRPLAELGVGEVLRSALRKLSAALPETRRPDETHMRQRFILDMAPLDSATEVTPFLDVLYQALMHNRCVWLSAPSLAGTHTEMEVEPLGLVAKAGVWYLVFSRAGKYEARRAADILDVRPLECHFERPEGFDLGAFWADWCSRYAWLAAQFPVRLRITRRVLPWLARRFGDALRAQAEAQDAQGAASSLIVDVTFTSHEAARDYLLPFGGAVEVLEPLPLRHSLQDYAEQIVARYR